MKMYYANIFIFVLGMLRMYIKKYNLIDSSCIAIKNDEINLVVNK